MNFFERQEKAKSKSLLLFFLFFMSIFSVVVTVYFLFLFGFDFLTNNGRHAPLYWQPTLFFQVGSGVCIIIGLASIFKIMILSSGGAAVAEYLGGRRVDSSTRDPGERQLLNVVEEIAIASGMPVPPVYVLDDENTINAFAAGLNPGDSVIAVTRGTLGFLNRDELQGVVAHEFSHIVNGDVKINIRLMGLLNGILFLAIIGRTLLRTSGRSSNRKGGGGQIVLLGLGLYVIGYVGVFFANLIKSAVSRQREYLADASAVQFTRNPNGITGALKKIGGCHQGRNLISPRADEASHMLFDSLVSFNWFATHPPLTDRIRAIDPHFNGQFEEPVPVDYKLSKEHVKDLHNVYVKRAFGDSFNTDIISNLSQQVGRVSSDNLAYSVHLIENLDEEIVDLTKDVIKAQGLIFAFLIHEAAGEVYPSPYAHFLEKNVQSYVFQETLKILPKISQIVKSDRLVLIEMAFPALKTMSVQQYERFKKIVSELIKSDNKVNLFEFCVSRMFINYLDQFYYPRKIPHVSGLKNVVEDIEIVLSALSNYGNSDKNHAQRSFERGMHLLGFKNPRLKSLEDCNFEKLEKSLKNLQGSSFKVKEQIINACGISIKDDQKVSVEEMELLRAISHILGCPMPPIV